jgi:hypothetical protein
VAVDLGLGTAFKGRQRVEEGFINGKQVVDQAMERCSRVGGRAQGSLGACGADEMFDALLRRGGVERED